MFQRRVKCSVSIACLLGLALVCLSRSVLASEETDDAALYNVAIETSMPHLEENLRYTKTTSTKCLRRSALFVSFPVLSENAFDECRLASEELSDNDASYRFVCPTSSGTTGTAIWRFDTSNFAGILEIKLGGKNMTFHQRITAKRIGECPSVNAQRKEPSG